MVLMIKRPQYEIRFDYNFVIIKMNHCQVIEIKMLLRIAELSIPIERLQTIICASYQSTFRWHS